MSLFAIVFQPKVSDEAGVGRYVRSVVALSLAVALSVDIVNQLVFFSGWDAALRDWALTAAVVFAIAIPIARSIGRAHLETNRARSEAERLSRTDPLTGLANRRAFYQAAGRLDGGALALVIADIDRFKRVNDRFGHAAGDEIIKAVAARMVEEIGDLGVVARIGGEEFALVCADRPVNEIQNRLTLLRQRVADEPIGFGGQAVFVTLSIGFAAQRGADLTTLYAAADRALYAAKAAGRDRVVDHAQLDAEPAPDNWRRAS